MFCFLNRQVRVSGSIKNTHNHTFTSHIAEEPQRSRKELSQSEQRNRENQQQKRERRTLTQKTTSCSLVVATALKSNCVIRSTASSSSVSKH